MKHLYNPDTALLTDPSIPLSWKLCILHGNYDDPTTTAQSLTGLRISSIFVIFIVSTIFTIFPLLSKSFKWIKMPLYVYLFARHFGTGVIISTAFIHLLDPAYLQIGAGSCVGAHDGWDLFPWVPALIMGSVFLIFLTDVLSDVVVQRKYGIGKNHIPANDEVMRAIVRVDEEEQEEGVEKSQDQRGFRSQIAAFLILEFGIIFHSVMIGLNLGAVGELEFKTLYIVLVFHQSFEGLGLGARLSGIPWPREQVSFIWAYLMCLMYGLVTPISIAIGISIRHQFNSNSFNVNVISGVLDSISCGILIYSGLVELLARDFIFNSNPQRDLKQLMVCIMSIIAGAGIMSAIGKWA